MLDYLMSQEKGPFEVPPRRTKVDEIRRSVPDAPKLYFRESKSNCVLCSFSSKFFFTGVKMHADHFKFEIYPS